MSGVIGDPESTGRPAFRRAPFRSDSVLLAAGQKTRSDILIAARAVFAERGFHGASIDEIARRCDRSSTSVYQYFSGKSEIVRLFVDSLGADLIAQARLLEPVTKGEPGRRRLAGWLSGMENVVRRHAATYAMWAAVETDELQLVQPARGFVDQWTRLVAPQLGVEDSSVLPFAVLSICSHVWERHLAGGWGCDDNALRDILATVAHRAIVARAGTATSTAEPLPRPADSDWPGVRRPVGPRAHASLSRMAQSAAFLIARHGVAGTTMAGVAEHARVRPASLYTYWTDKTHLLATLSARVAPTLDRLLAEAEELRPTAPELSRWVARAATLDDEALAVLRWWQEGVPVQPATEQARRQRDEITARAGTAVDRMLELSHGPALAMSPELLLVLWCTLDFSRTAGHLLGPDRTADVVAAITRFLSGAFRAAGGTLRGVVPLP